MKKGSVVRHDYPTQIHTDRWKKERTLRPGRPAASNGNSDQLQRREDAKLFKERLKRSSGLADA